MLHSILRNKEAKDRASMIQQSFFNARKINIFFILVVLFALPVAHVASIQNITLGIFSIITMSMMKKEDLNSFLHLRFFLSLYFLILILALISIKYSINSGETIDEIRGEIIKPFFVFCCIYIYVSKISTQQIYYLFTIICAALFFHTLLNIFVWIYNGGWPARTGGFLDGTIGTAIRSAERFGIYATYALAISIALFFTKYKKFAFLLLFLSLISIVANNTRATFIGMLFIFICYFIFIYKNKIFKLSLLILMFVSIISFIFYSKNLQTRFNAYNLLSQTEYLIKYSPSEYDKLIQEHHMEFSSVSRLAMWKSALLYRIQDPFTPLGYGRFLYKGDIQKLWEKNPQNIPFVLFPQLHSDFMSILFSLGIFGLIAFIGILGYFFKISYDLIKKSQEYKFIGIFLFLGLSGHIASMLFGSFFGDSEKIYFFILYGFALALYSKTKEKPNEKTLSASSK